MFLIVLCCITNVSLFILCLCFSTGWAGDCLLPLDCVHWSAHVMYSTGMHCNVFIAH